jgi:integrase
MTARRQPASLILALSRADLATAIGVSESTVDEMVKRGVLPKPMRLSEGGVVSLPKAVHVVVSRGREYFYFQAGRGTDREGPRVRLPDDAHAPSFWEAIRVAQGMVPEVSKSGTLNHVIDAYMASPAYTHNCTKSTQYQYLQSLKIMREAWGHLPACDLTPKRVREMMDGFASRPGKANNFLTAMRALQSFALPRGDFEHSVTDGIRPYMSKGGHRPWTPEQLRAIDRLPGTVRRGIMLYNYTGQRGSDVVRLGWTDMDEGGFALRQRKTRRPVWCPIMPELAAEMASWEKRPGPFLLQPNGRPYSRKLFWKHFEEARSGIPELADVTLHGLRCTAVIRLCRLGLSVPEISNIVGMSLATIERYKRFADQKIGGQAVLLRLNRRNCPVCNGQGWTDEPPPPSPPPQPEAER